MSHAPPTLKVYALLVLAVAALSPDHDAGLWWVGLVMVGLTLVWVLLGSRFGWWIQVVAVASGMAGAVGVWRQLASETDAVWVFVPPVTLTAISVMLLGAAVCLVAPPTRAYCSDKRDGPRSAWGIAFGALLIGSFPACALSLDSRLPPSGNAQSTPNLVFMGDAGDEPVAFYVGGAGDELCLVTLAPRSSSRSCHHGRTWHTYAWRRSERVGAGLAPLETARVEVVYRSGRTHPAELLSEVGARAKVYFVTESLDEVLGVRAYDASGRKIVRCPFCYLSR